MEATKYFENANVKPKSLKTYNSLYKNHLKQYEKNGVFKVNDIDKITKNILDKNVSNNTIMSVLQLFMNIVEANGEDITKLKNLHRELFEKKKSDTMARKMVKKDLPTYEEIEEYLKYLYKKKEWRTFVVNFILFNYITRNEDVDLYIIHDKKDLNNEDNFLLIRKTDIVYIRNKYKTRDSYGVKKYTIRSKKFYNSVNELYASGNTRVLTSNSNLTQEITKYTFQHISESDMAKIVVANIDLNKNMNKLIELGERRGTSKEVLLSEYRLDDRV